MEPEHIYSHLDVPFAPLWIVAVGLLTALPACSYLGYRAGRATYLARGYDHTPPKAIPGDTSRGAILGLLGLLLAFTFASALGWHNDRNDAITEEAAALSTAFLNADLVAEPGRSALQEALLDYARSRDFRNRTLRTEDGLEASIERTLDAQAALWPATLDAIGGETPPPIQVAVARAVTDVLDAHTRRVAAASETIPPVAELMLLFTAMGALALAGNNSALRGRPLTWRTFAFAILLAVVMLVILDMDRALDGFIRINTDAIKVTVAELEQAVAPRQ